MVNRERTMKTTTRRVKQKFDSPAIPVNDAPSNARGDLFAGLAFFGLLGLAVCLVFGGGIFCSTLFIQSLTKSPIDWFGALIMALSVVASVFVARNLTWLAFFASTMIAARMAAWKTLESVTRRALKLYKVLPNGSAWASAALVQSLVNRGIYEEALNLAELEWERTGTDAKQAQNLGPMCFAAGIATQAGGDLKTTMKWNERAITALNNCLEQLAKPPKGFFAKAASSQGSEMAKQVRMQLAPAYFNNATIYFNSMDYRRARENYRLAVEHAMKAPDFPQKKEMVRSAQEQITRLKHS